MRAPIKIKQDSLRQLPPVNALLETEQGRALLSDYPRSVVLDEIRVGLESVRQHLRDSGVAEALPFSAEAFLEDIEARLKAQGLKRLQRVINATGIVIHTNMGRSPLAASAVEAVRAVALGYSNLELDLETGKRGGRGGQIESLLQWITGAEAAIVVNNNAAAVLLALTTLAQGGEVVISRGELVEIGGGFRVPDVIRQSNARLVEVGTTNKTRLADYAQAVTPETKILLKVHPSNYRIVGFTSEATVAELSELARERDVIVMNDLGSGALVDLMRYGLPREPTVTETLAAGADVVTVSGDKLLGGPQCGVILGVRHLVKQMASHPLFRALRADKMTLAALEATLRLYLVPETLADNLPVLQMLARTPEQLARKARRLSVGLKKLPGLWVRVIDGVSYAGGGSLPEAGLPTKLVQVRSVNQTVDCLAERLRRHNPPVLGMRADDAYVLDVRTVSDGEIREVITAFSIVLGL